MSENVSGKRDEIQGDTLLARPRLLRNISASSIPWLDGEVLLPHFRVTSSSREGAYFASPSPLSISPHFSNRFESRYGAGRALRLER